MTSDRVSQHAFFGVSALLFVASAALTIAWCLSMSGMGMRMPGDWTMSMTWMRMPGQTWPGAAASFLGMWLVMMVAMMLPSLIPALWHYRRAVDGLETPLGRLTVLVAVALSPLVSVLARFMKAWIASALVMITLVTAVSLTAFALSDEAVELSQELPRIAREVRLGVARASPRDGLLGQWQKAAAELERTAAPAPASPATPVTVVTPVDVRRSLVTGAWTMAGWAGTLILFSFFVFALLSSGAMF